MTAREITAIAIKFLALWLTVNVVLYLPSLLLTLTAMSTFTGENFNRALLFSSAGMFVLLGLVSATILFRIANSILTSQENASPTNLSQRFLLQLGGVFFIVSALKSLSAVAFSYLQSSALTQSAFNNIYMFGYIFELPVGLFLLIRPQVWASWLAYFRGRAN